jgi:hypothetical protein
MTSIDARLLVALKGTDLAARTARLALVDKMGFGARLLALKRFDYFRFGIDSPAQPDATIDALSRLLDRQSTFYNRNKHVYSLACAWEGGERVLGVARADLLRQWSKHIEKTSVTDSDGKISTEEAIVNISGRYLVEVLVEDDDQSARASIAARIRGGLSEGRETRGAEVTCFNRATVWWLAICASDAEAAERTARDITVTTRRDRGLLMNPNYQVAEFLSVQPFALESG